MVENSPAVVEMSPKEHWLGDTLWGVGLLMLFTLQASCRTEACVMDTFPRGQNPGQLIVLFLSSLGGVGHTVVQDPSWWG